MTSGNASGVIVLNALFLFAGFCVLWGLRGWRSWSECLQLAGVAYMLGLASVCTAATLVLVGGGGLSVVEVVVLVTAVAAAGIALAAFKRRPLPSSFAADLRRPSWSFGRVAAVAAGVVTAALLVALLRVARYEPLTAFDAWAFWTPKAKAIYFFGGLDEELFASLPGPSYPLLVPALQAMGFHFMGAADTTTLAVQYWLLFTGFIAAAAGLLRSLASPALVWLFLGLAVATPEIGNRILHPQADWPLDIFFVLAALFALRWLATTTAWPLVGCGVMLAAAIATKREGALLAAALVAGVVVASVRRPRVWAPVVGVALAAVVVNVPWRLWWTSRELMGDVPTGALAGLGDNSSRVLPSMRLVAELLFAYEQWLVAVPLAVAAALAALTLKGREAAVVYLVASTLTFAALTWVLWSDPNLELSTRQSATPIPRAVGAIVLLSLALAPVLLDQLLRSRHEPQGRATSQAAAGTP